MKRQPPFDPAFLDPVDGIYNDDPDAPYVNGDPRIGREGSIPPMEALDHPMRELVHLIEFSEQTPSHTDLEQVRKAIKFMIDFLIEIGKSGDGVDLFHGNDAGIYLFRSLVAGDNTTLSVVTNPETGRSHIRIDTVGSGGGVSGESNTGSNLGTTGARVFEGKSGLDLRFRRIKAGTNVTVTEGADDIEIAVPSIAAPSLATVAPAIMVQQTRLPSTPPTALIKNQWTLRPLNDLLVNQISGASFNSSTQQITLPAGTYRATFLGVAGNAGSHRTRLFNLTGGVTLGIGNSADSQVGSNDTCNSSIGIARFTLEATSVLVLQTYWAAGSATGAKMGDTEENYPEVHVDGWVEIIKEA